MAKLKHELAVVGTRRLMEVFGSILRPEEQVDAAAQMYSVLFALLQNYDREAGATRRGWTEASKN